MSEKLGYDPQLLREIMDEYGLRITGFSKFCGISKSVLSRLRDGTYHLSVKSAAIWVVIDKLTAMGCSRARQIVLSDVVEEDLEDGTNPTQKKEKRRLDTMDFRTRKFFSFTRDPFDNYENVDISKMYFNDEYENVVETAMDAIERKRFLVVSGEVGTGKSTIVQRLLTRLESDRMLRVLHLSPLLVENVDDLWVAKEIIAAIGQQEPPRENRQIVKKVAEVILNLRQDNVGLAIILDEAHRLPPATWRGLKRLCGGHNITNENIAVVAFGQPEIEGLLNDRGMREVGKRAAILEFKPFTRGNGRVDVKAVQDYITLKLKNAGVDGELFTPDAIEAFSKNVESPLEVNNLCNHYLVKAASVQEKVVTYEVVTGREKSA